MTPQSLPLIYTATVARLADSRTRYQLALHRGSLPQLAKATEEMEAWTRAVKEVLEECDQRGVTVGGEG